MITAIVEVLATVLDTLIFLWFIPKFIDASIKDKLWTIFIPALQLAVQLLFDWLMPGFSLLPMIVVLFLAFAFAVLLSPNTVWWNAFASVAYISLIMLVSSFLYSIFPFFIDDMDAAMQGSNSQVRILYIVIAKLVLFFACKLVLMLFKKEKSIEISNAIMTLILIFGTVVGLTALMKIATVNTFDEVNFPILLIAGVLIIVNILLYLFIYQIQKLQKSKYELKLINERIALDRRQSEDANVIWNNIRKVRHDLKNHFSVMKGCLEQGETAACCDYINSIQQTVESMGTLIRSGNSVIDYMINLKLSNLEGVQILVSGCVGNFKDISDADMVGILGNILDNAVEALQKVSATKRLELYFSKVKQNRLIICKNSINASVLENNKELSSTKNDPESHGLGHHIIESTVRKYGGLVGYFEDDGLFGVEISIPELIE